MFNRIIKSTVLFSLITSMIFAADVTLSFGDVDLDAGTMDIYMENTVPVAGFQFQLENLNLLGASGGTAQNNNFMVSTNPSGLVLGFSLTGATIPAGEGVLTQLAIDGLIIPDDQVCISTATVSGAGGTALDTDYSACWPEVEPQLEAPQNLTATGGENELVLEWDAVTDSRSPYGQ